MQKLRLDLDAVVVESFSTARDPLARTGTVRGQAADRNNTYDPCTLDGCSYDGNCSMAMACSRQDCSGYCTGYEGCSLDDNCSQEPGCTGIGVCYWTP